MIRRHADFPQLRAADKGISGQLCQPRRQIHLRQGDAVGKGFIAQRGQRSRENHSAKGSAPGKGAVLNDLQPLREDHPLQLPAVGKGAAADYPDFRSHRIGSVLRLMQEGNQPAVLPIHQAAVLHGKHRMIRIQLYLRQIIAHGEGIVPQLLQSRRQRDAPQAFAAGKGPAADALQRGGQGNGSNRVTGAEGLVADGNHALRHRHAGQAAFLIERALADRRHRNPVQLRRNHQLRAFAGRRIAVIHDPGRLILHDLIHKNARPPGFRSRAPDQGADHDRQSRPYSDPDRFPHSRLLRPVIIDAF